MQSSVSFPAMGKPVLKYLLMKELLRTMLDHFQNMKRHTDTSTSINNICLIVIVLFPSNCFCTSSFNFIKEEGTIYCMHDSELKTGFILFFSTVHCGPGTSGTTTNALCAFSLHRKTHALGRLCTPRFHRENR